MLETWHAKEHELSWPPKIYRKVRLFLVKKSKNVILSRSGDLYEIIKEGREEILVI